MDLDFTPRNVAKYVVKAAIHGYTQQIAEDAITDHTSYEKDDMIVRISSNLVGWGVSDKLKPYTDKMVDKTADFIAAKRESHQSKKNTTETTEK